MKKLILVLLVLASTIATAQKPNAKAEITKVLNEYSALMEQGKVDTALGFMYPKFFEIYPRAIVADAMNKAFTDTMLGFSFGKMEIKKVTKPLTYNGIKYSLVSYAIQTKMFYKKPLADNPTQEKDVFDLSANMIKQMYGEDNVVVDFASRSFTINMNNSLFAINDPAYGYHWWFIEKKEELKPQIIDKLIPAKVWDKLGKEKKK